MQSLAGKRLVIFGCGYVGRAAAEWALGQGLHVTALTRNSDTAQQLRTAGVDVVVADLATPDWHARVAGGPHFVLNCVSSGGGGIEAYRRSYVDGMVSIAAWARARGRVGTIVYTGSTSVYPQDGGARVDEASPVSDAAERPALLLEAEAKLATATEAWNRWFVLRLAGIYGPERHMLLEQVRSGVVGGKGEHHLNLIHRDDAVAAIAAAFAAPASVGSQVLNVADDGAARKVEVVNWLAQALGLPAPTFSGEPAAGRRMVTPDRVILNSRCKTLLGWAPRYSTFREGYASLLSR